VKKPTPFGKYFLLERISIGGMAEVFRSKAFGVEGFERLVAVKRILPSIAEDKDFIRLFIEEAKLAVQLNHANIAQIFDLGVVDGAYYVALEHVHGRDLHGIFERCRQLGEAMPVAQACFMAMKVCEGLDYAHNKRDQAGRELGLVHRDVSPQNILVSFEGEVKLIDFGIAKAAGMGSKTQAGILKGKLGYLSPEQVRGGEVDRRSDVFSCGVVLYELLTGERLFAGDSDFATQAKVRSVEILPPSTYNRKIPDELERIVLKALAKYAGDRYQHAIDLHDELQAFVYTAGEFYSRKDLAGWMKKTFGKEIEEETAKLESYRQLKPPTQPPGSSAGAAAPPAPTSLGIAVAPAGLSVARAATASKLPPRVQTQPVPLVRPPTAPPIARSQPIPVRPQGQTRPPDVPVPPPPPRSSEPTLEIAIEPPAPRAAPSSTREPQAAAHLVPRTVLSSTREPQVTPALAPRTVSSSTREPQATPALAPRAVPSSTREPQAAAAAAKPAILVAARLDPSAIGWEDDDVETQIYADQDAEVKPKLPQRANLPLQAPAPAPSSAGIGLAGAAPLRTKRASPAVALSAAVPLRARPPTPGLTPPPSAALASGWERPAPSEFPVGSNTVTPEPRFDLHDRTEPAAKPVAGREISAASRLVSTAQSETDVALDPMASFGARITGGRRPSNNRHTALTVAVGAAAVAATAVVLVLLSSRGAKPPAPVAAPVTKPAVADPSTGFDLYVVPSGVTQWKLDGESRTDRLPSRIRGITPGAHTVQIEPPPGFLSQLQQVEVEPGKAPRIEIKLQPVAGLVGSFETTPPGATVSLIVDGKRQPVGLSPATAPLDPRSVYQVLFEKPGYVSVNRPITFAAGLEQKVAVTLEKASAADAKGQRRASPPPQERPAPDKRGADHAAGDPAASATEPKH
jgi:serine/threonine protein kinase